MQQRDRHMQQRVSDAASAEIFGQSLTCFKIFFVKNGRVKFFFLKNRFLKNSFHKSSHRQVIVNAAGRRAAGQMVRSGGLNRSNSWSIQELVSVPVHSAWQY